MRRVAAAMILAGLLAGCTAFDRDRGDPPAPRGAPTRTTRPSPTASDWTDAQRDCEVGRRKRQRQCVMPFPGTGVGGGAVGTLPRRPKR